MFGIYTIDKDSTDVSSNRYTSKPRVSKNKSGKTTNPNKIIEKKKADLEALKEKLAKEQEELEQTLQESLRQQEDAYRAYEDMFAEDPLTIALNESFIATTSNYKRGSRYNAVKGSFDAASVNFNKNNNSISFDALAQKGLKYSSKSGHKLAKDVANNSVGFTHNCSKYVRQGLQRTGLYNGHTRNAYQMAGVLSQNKNFQEVSPSSVNLKQLPAGCIVVYDKGAAGYSSKSGHIEVTLGDGTACSDGRTYNMRKAQNMRIFVPVEQA